MHPPLREIRTQLQWTQERMAKELFVSLRTYCRQEVSGGDKTLRKLAVFVQKYNEPEAEKRISQLSRCSAQ